MFTINHRVVHALMGLVYLSSCGGLSKTVIGAAMFVLYMVLVWKEGDC